MSKTIRRLLALSLGVLLAGASVQAAVILFPSSRGARLVMIPGELLRAITRERLDLETAARNERVLAELEQLDDHPWAGVYRTRGKWPNQLVIAPRAGVTLYHGSGCGNCSGWRGAADIVEAEGSRLSLRLDREVEIAPAGRRSLAYYRLDETLYLVEWGELLFAVPTWRMERFCAEAVNGATFPWVPFRYVGDDPEFDPESPQRPEGLPRIPDEFRRWLPGEPVSCRIASFVELRPLPKAYPSQSEAYLDAVYELDRGVDGGLVAGMRLFIEGGEPGYIGYSGRVELAERNSARLAISHPGGPGERFVGNLATTVHPNAVASRR